MWLVFCVCVYLFYLSIISLLNIFLGQFCCHCWCSWLPNKTRFQHDLLSSKWDIEPCVLSQLMKEMSYYWRCITDSSSKCVTVTAVSDQVESTRRALMQLLDNEDRRLSDPLEIRKTNGVQAYLRALATQSVYLPSYWTAHNPGADVTASGGGELVCNRTMTV